MWDGLRDRTYWRKLSGTAGVLFLYCFLCWGVLLIQPSIVHGVWGSYSSSTDGSGSGGVTTSTLNRAVWQNVILLLTQLPGIVNTILVIGKVECKWLLFWGFCFFSLSTIIMGTALYTLPSSTTATSIILMVLLCVVNYFLVWGSVGCIILLPSLVFPPECRGTYFGLSVAAGKVGAAVGVYLYRALFPVIASCGVMFLTAFVSGCACLLVWVAVDPRVVVGGKSSLACKEAVAALVDAWPYGDMKTLWGGGRVKGVDEERGAVGDVVVDGKEESSMGG
eukprot:GHVS01007520.1.p1 GENE.GHVS01007520.1~~GHVS01007520.1.p1  ORF type:complete len:279 (+),score=43.90 GHVS01007520.1:208-1044(+)